jgi:hypothetical protein
MHIIKIDNKNYVKKITKPIPLPEIEKEWKLSLGYTKNYHPYLTSEWYGMWLDHFMKDKDSTVLMFYRDDILQMIVPLLSEKKAYRGASVKIQKLVGNIYSPIKSIITNVVTADSILGTMDRLLKYFAITDNEWDILDFDALPGEEPWVDVFCKVIKRSAFRSRTYDCFGNWYIEGINGSSRDYIEKRSKNFRASVKKNYNKLRQSGEVVFRMVTGEDDYPGYFNLYNEVYSRSWKKEERVGRTFFPAMVRYAERNGWLRLGLLFVNGRPIGAGFAIVSGGRAYFEKISYDESYKGLGAGSVCLYEMIKHVIDEDSVSTIDFLRGDDEYKRHWVDKHRLRNGIMVYNNNFKGRYLSLLDQRVVPVINKNQRIRKIKEAVVGLLR